MPRLHKSKRDLPPIAMTEKSAATDETIVRVTTFATPEDDMPDAFESVRGIQRNGRIELKYRPIPDSRSGAMEDTIDPFSEPLD